MNVGSLAWLKIVSLSWLERDNLIGGNLTEPNKTFSSPYIFFCEWNISLVELILHCAPSFSDFLPFSNKSILTSVLKEVCFLLLDIHRYIEYCNSDIRTLIKVKDYL